MSGIVDTQYGGAQYTACYSALQYHLLSQYGRELTDIKVALEKTTGSDSQKQAQFGGKLQLLSTALHILNRQNAQVTKDEYAALVRLGERIKSTVELYRAHKSKRLSMAASPCSQQALHFATELQLHSLQPADPSWELPLEFINNIISEEHHRISPAPTATLPEQAQHMQRSGSHNPLFPKVNPFMQQALAIAQGARFGSTACSPSSTNSLKPSLPPLPLHSTGNFDHGTHSLEIPTGFGHAAAEAGGHHSWGGADHASTNPTAMAFRAAFYTAGDSGSGSAGERWPCGKRPASALGAYEETEESSCAVERNGEGSTAGAAGSGGRGRTGRPKYRSVSFDEPNRLRTLHSRPEVEFQGFRGGGELPVGACNRGGGADNNGQVAGGNRQTISLDPMHGGACATPTSGSATPVTRRGNGHVSPFTYLSRASAPAAQHTQQQNHQQELLSSFGSNLPVPGSQPASPFSQQKQQNQNQNQAVEATFPPPPAPWGHRRSITAPQLPVAVVAAATAAPLPGSAPAPLLSGRAAEGGDSYPAPCSPQQDTSTFDFDLQLMGFALPSQQHPAQQPENATDAGVLKTSGLLPLTTSNYDALTIQVQHSLTEWSPLLGHRHQQQQQQQQSAAGTAQRNGRTPPTAPASTGVSAEEEVEGGGGHTGSSSALQQQKAESAPEAAPASADMDALGSLDGAANGAWRFPFGTDCSMPDGLGEQQDQQQTSAFAANSSGGEGRGVRATMSSPPFDGCGSPHWPSGGTLIQAPSLPSLFSSTPIQQMPSLPLSMLDTNRFDSLLFELGPDFLPDFDGGAGLGQEKKGG